MTNFHASFIDYVAPSGWKLSRALRRLDVATEDFDYANNEGADGYSHGRVLAIRSDPKMWTLPIIAAHELAHIVLGHTAYVLSAREMGLKRWFVPFDQFELEAHAVAKAVGYGMELAPQDFRLELVQRYIDAAKENVPPLHQKAAVRLAKATLTILEAGERSRKANVVQEEMYYKVIFSSVGGGK